jgi:hypothetical protein
MSTILAKATVTVTWTDNNGSLVDPDTITLQVQRNNSAWTPITGITQVSTGVYEAEYDCPYTGEYIFEWYGIKTSNGLSRRERAQLSVH